MHIKGFPPVDEWFGLILFVFVAIIAINTVASRVPAIGRIEGGF